MKRFSFTTKEIDAHKMNFKEWHDFIRGREAEIIFSLFSETKFDRALEIGAGDGGQSVIIAKHCNHLICTELDEKSHNWLGQGIMTRKLPNVEYLICDAQDLCRFKDKSFDLIFSSNLLEHIPDLNKCLSECKRVLKDNGIMLHTMPSRYWKLLQSFLSILKLRKANVHGIESNNLSEFISFGRRVWISKIENEGFKAEEIVSLPFYVGHGNSFIPVIKAGNLLRLPASYLYVVRKRLFS